MSVAVVTCLWPGDRGYCPEVVNRLARSVKRHLSLEHRFVCMSSGFPVDEYSSDVDQVVSPPPDAAKLLELKSPEGDRFPASYARLWWLSRHAQAFGDWIFMLDADAVVVGGLDELIVTNKGGFIGWRPSSRWGRGPRIAGGTWLCRAGTRDHLYLRMLEDPLGEIVRAREEGYRGSDQALLSKWLGPSAPVWPAGHGIYQTQDVRKFPGRGRQLPKDARIVHFNGDRKPWHMNAATMPWLPEHWR